MNHFLISLTLSLAFLATPVFAQNTAKIEGQFQAWLQNDLWPEAKRNGVSKRKFNSAFKGVTLNWKLPDLVPPGTKPKAKRKQVQSEFKSPARYFNPNNMNSVVSSGKKLAKKHKRLISRIEKKYGVPGSILLAVWGRAVSYTHLTLPTKA